MSNVWQAFFTICKAIVGAGSFSLPWCMMNMGVYAGFGTIVVVAILSGYTMLMLLRVRKAVAQQTLRNKLTYVDLGRFCFGKGGAGVAYTLSLIASMGVAGAYIVFIASTLESLVPSVSKAEWSIITAVAVIPITLLRSYVFLSFTSVFGDCALVLGMVATLYVGFTTRHLAPLSAAPVLRLDTYPESFGSVAFLFCIHFLILPIERSMTHRDKYRLSMYGALSAVTLTNAGFGVLGFLFYGDATKSIVILNLGHSVFLTIVKLCLCIDLYCSYAIVFAPGREIVEHTLLDTSPEAGGGKTWQRNAIRVGLVAFTCGIAQVKEFGVITNIVGGLAMCTLGFVVPPIMLMRLNAMPQWRRRSSEFDSVQASVVGPSHTVVVGVNGAVAGGDPPSCSHVVNGAGYGRDSHDKAAAQALLGPGKGKGASAHDGVTSELEYAPLPAAGVGALQEGLPLWELVACALLVCFGAVAAVATTYVSVHDLVS